jgi:hypothetical protein
MINRSIGGNDDTVMSAIKEYMDDFSFDNEEVYSKVRAKVVSYMETMEGGSWIRVKDTQLSIGDKIKWEGRSYGRPHIPCPCLE